MPKKPKFKIADVVRHETFSGWGVGEILYVDEDTMQGVTDEPRYHVAWENRRPPKLWCVESELLPAQPTGT
jgi:heat shock protein HspQ